MRLRRILDHTHELPITDPCEPSAIAEVLGVAVPDAHTIVVRYTSGMDDAVTHFTRTDDRHAHWSPVADPSPAGYPGDPVFPNAAFAYGIAGGDGLVVSHDGGQTFTVVPVP